MRKKSNKKFNNRIILTIIEAISDKFCLKFIILN